MKTCPKVPSQHRQKQKVMGREGGGGLGDDRITGKLGPGQKVARSSKKFAYRGCGRENGSGSAAEDPAISIFGIFWSSPHFFPFAPRFSIGSRYCQIPPRTPVSGRPIMNKSTLFCKQIVNSKSKQKMNGLLKPFTK